MASRRVPWAGPDEDGPDPILAAWGERAIVRTDCAPLRLPAAGWTAWVTASPAVDAATVDAEGRQAQARIDPSAAPARFEAGATICADVSAQPEVAAWLAALTEVLRPHDGAPFAKLYVSPPGAGFAMHFDHHHVLVMQLSGRKRWWYGETPAHPHARYGGKLDASGRAVHTYPRDGFPVLDADGRPQPGATRDQLSSRVLAPGDLLYLPPGTWHTTRAEETSVAVSFSPPRVALVDLVLGALRERLERDPTWRADVRGTSSEGRLELPVRALRWGTRALSRTVDAITVEDLAVGWARRAFAAERPVESVPGDLDGGLRHADGGFTWLRAPDPDTGDDAVALFRPGVELWLPRETARFVERLAGQPRFTLADAIAFEPKWPEADVRELLGGLLEAGVLVPAD